MGIFNGLTNLRGLRLYNNELSGLPIGIFNDLTNLRGLFLHNNALSEENKKELRDVAVPGEKVVSF